MTALMIKLNPTQVTTLLEFFYSLVGLISLSAAFYIFKDEKHEKRLTSSLFWALLGIIFIAGPYLDKFLVGILVIIMGVLTTINGVKPSKFVDVAKARVEERALRLKGKVFIPAISIAAVALLCSIYVKPSGSLIGLGAGSFIAILLALLITKAEPKMVPEEGSRLLQQISTSAILPQLLAALGAVFATAKVGDVISTLFKNIVPQNNLFLGVVFYCLAMAIFTIIMGNAFAAFTVITAGIGVPYVLNQGANPAVVGALALCAGYCGTLITPMAANFNIVPAAILETKNKYKVIIEQAKVAIMMLISIILLMYFLGYGFIKF